MKQIKGLLLHPPNQLIKGVETPRPDGSLGPLYLAANLERNGIETDILDASIGPSGTSLKDSFYREVEQKNGLIRIGMDFKEIAKYVSDQGYNFVGINSNFTPQTNMAIQTAKAIKKSNPNIKVYAGGVNARALYTRFLKTGFFDAVCLTEGELIFPKKIAKDFRLSKYEENEIPGFAINTDNGPHIIPVNSSCFPKELDDLPIPAFDKIDFNRYGQLDSPHGINVTGKEIKSYAHLMTSRGCPYKCLYCHISSEKMNEDFTGKIGNLRLHSIERVVEEIDLVKSFGVERIFFEDDSLLAHKKRVKEIFTRVQDRGLGISDVNGVNLIHFFNRGKTNEKGQWLIDEEYIEILKNAGFDQIIFPIESGVERIINTYASGKVKFNKMNVLELMKTMTNKGIKAPVNMMIGFPDETEDEIQQSVDLARRLKDNGAPYVTFFIPIPFPGSRLYDIALEGGYLNKDFDPDIFNWKNPVMKNTAVNPERLVELRDRANEEINTREHIERRLKNSAGMRLRWLSN